MAEIFPSGAPALSTSETRIFEDSTPAVDTNNLARLSDDQLLGTYEVVRTVREIRAGGWRRIALQFPDHFLIDAPRVVQALGTQWNRGASRQEQPLNPLGPVSTAPEDSPTTHISNDEPAVKLYVLADTSYSACCVDEIAAEHVNADVIVHYGRACLSPTARLPVIYVFTTAPLSLESVVSSFKDTYPDPCAKIILMADIPYSHHILPLCNRLRNEGYGNIFATSIVHDPSSPLPNRTTPSDTRDDKPMLGEYQLFHISDPPPSLLLTLSSRVGAVHIYPTQGRDDTPPPVLPSTSSLALRRRYALVTSLSTVSIFGILINTLSVRNYLHVVEHVKKQIAEAGKKSYTFVVGKVNAAKIANFSEVGGWVVIGCWESSLIESKDFWRPLITPFELSLALQSDARRVWTGEWTSDFEAVLLDQAGDVESPLSDQAPNDNPEGPVDSEEESEPPEFDLRTGSTKHVAFCSPAPATPSPSARTKDLCMFPCTLRREDCLSGDDLALALRLKSDGTMIGVAGDLFLDPASSPPPSDGRPAAMELAAQTARTQLSPFEHIIFSCPPILESLFSYLPTTAVLDLFHTSVYLRTFLKSYPLAWKTLSFRGPQPPSTGPGSPGNEGPDGGDRQTKARALDALLIQVVVPFGTRLRSLDLCNTSVSGVALTSKVLESRIATLEHLSVRSCKNVSMRYHLVPFLQMHNPSVSPYADPKAFALRSLYAYRCRHHRRRPYLSTSLARRESDSDPTHDLIELCHAMGIWTDTAWCTTPGGRCFRRKDYHAGRAAPGTAEVWVPFDRLWRSSNRVGPTGESTRQQDGRLWEEECGHNGEALGPDDRHAQDGKEVPTHLRRSYRTFVEHIKCDSCGDRITERCEQCSIRMHCMGCRQTLCGSCAFNRPLPRKRQKTQNFMNLAFGHSDHVGTMMNLVVSASAHSQPPTRLPSSRKPKFWWAPEASRSPNLMIEPASDEDDSDSEGTVVNGHLQLAAQNPPKLMMYWCCIEPIFSGGGGIAFMGPGLTGQGADRIRAVPLPRDKRFEDRDFTPRLRSSADVQRLKDQTLYEHVLGENVDVVPYLKRDSLKLQARTCPRNLCQPCYRTFHWKVACRSCRKPLCKEHDFRGLKLRKCGWRDLSVEREFVRNAPPTSQLRIPPYRSADDAPLIDLGEETSTHDDSFAAFQSVQKPLAAPRTASETFSSGSADMSASFTSHALQAIAPTTRPRAFSLSELRARTNVNLSLPNSSPIMATGPAPSLPLPCHPRHPVQWQGCGSYFCQQYRPVGDCRPRCSASIRECTECGVYVCEFCLLDNPPCTCTHCTSTYHCPHCARKPSVELLCQKEEEERARQVAEDKEAERRRREDELVQRANELADSVREFFDGWDEGLGAMMADALAEVVGSEQQPSDDSTSGAGSVDAPGVSL